MSKLKMLIDSIPQQVTESLKEQQAYYNFINSKKT